MDKYARVRETFLLTYCLYMKFIFIGLMLTFSIYASAGEIFGRVIGVADGDTITILDSSNTQFKIRLSGIDAPEKKQPYGNASKKSLSTLVYGKEVTVEWLKRDRYQRVVGKVLVNGVDVNLEQIKRGMAWFFKHYQNEQPPQDRLDYAEAQDAAEQGRLGLWSEDEPTPPWEFRRQI